MLMLTVVSSILSLIFILLSYFGLIRYISMYIYSSEKFIYTYSSLPKTTDKRVVITFSTTPSQIHKIKPMINSLLDQTVRVDRIILSIPYKYKGEKYEIPEYLKKVVTVIPSGKDYGECLGVIPTLLKEKESDTIIICVKDTKVYGKDFIETLLEHEAKNANTIIRLKDGSATLLKPEHFSSDIVSNISGCVTNDWLCEQGNGFTYITYDENFRLL
jgi:hypothetical protein